MKVIVTLTITGEKETMLEGYASFVDSDVLEQKGIGFWLDSWKRVGEKRPHKSRCFCPWSSVLMVETKDEAQEQVHQTLSYVPGRRLMHSKMGKRLVERFGSSQDKEESK